MRLDIVRSILCKQHRTPKMLKLNTVSEMVCYARRVRTRASYLVAMSMVRAVATAFGGDMPRQAWPLLRDMRKEYKTLRR